MLLTYLKKRFFILETFNLWVRKLIYNKTYTNKFKNEYFEYNSIKTLIW